MCKERPILFNGEMPEPLKAIKIIDIIKHKYKDGTQTFVVINRFPDFKYERKGSWLIGEDGGFFNFYHNEKPWGRFKAFAGREFEIPMIDGSVIKASGQWWDKVPSDYHELLINEGCNTIERLHQCNVFSSLCLEVSLIENWIDANDPSNNYNKYASRSSDYGKHVIVSKWQEADNA